MIRGGKMRELAYIAKIQNLEPIKDKDRIELATVANWEVIVGKGEFNVGDLVVYVEYDTILPPVKQFEFLRKRCYSKLYDGFRIRNMSMAGVFSQGIVFPVDILPKGVPIKEGQIVAKNIGVVRYDPEEKKQERDIQNPKSKNLLIRYKWFRKLRNKYLDEQAKYPKTVKEADETNVQKLFNKYKEKYGNDWFYLTEKIEGQAATFILKKGKFHTYSHKRKVKNNGKNNWSKVAKKYNIENKLREYKRKNKVELAIQGEVAGPRIQDNIYKFDDFRFFVYSITNVKTGEVFNFHQLKVAVMDLELEMVPFISMKTINSFGSLKNILEFSDGKSILYDTPREGIVWRLMSNAHLGFKAKSSKYLAKESKKDTIE
jgi:hypothetical protein